MTTAIQPARSRSPVMSIRTQPEEDRNLIAEMEAASRTQHEILPRYSWHSTFSKRDGNHPLRRSYPPVLRKDLPPSQIARTFAMDSRCGDESSVQNVRCNIQSKSLSPNTSNPSRKPWRKFTKRSLKSSLVHPIPLVLDDYDSTGYGGHEAQPDAGSYKHDNEVVAHPGRESQNQWLADRSEEENTIEDLPSNTSLKPKRTVRKSIYGSLSSTKSFFRNASKTPRNGSSGRFSPGQSSIPHIYDFETKNHLSEYLDANSAVSPLSPIRPPRAFSIPFEVGPAELSAVPDPQPAELEDNKPNASPYHENTMSCTSTPSLRELPPYSDNKKFRSDLAKDDSVRIHNRLEEDSVVNRGTIYTCTSCRKTLTNYEVYDFCSVCAPGERVFCNFCARSGPYCQHDLQEQLRDLSLDDSVSMEQVNVSNTASPTLSSEHPMLQGTSTPGVAHKPIQPTDIESPEERRSPTASGGDMLDTDIKNIHLEFVKEMGSMRREHALLHRERELTLRAREIELRDQHTTLREQQAIFQQKNDMLMRNLESLVSYQTLAQSAVGCGRYETSKNSCNPEVNQDNTSPNPTTHLKVSEKLPAIRVKFQGSNNDAPDTGTTRMPSHYRLPENDDSHVKSHAAQKRKKSNGGGSQGQTQPPVSTPPQHRKSLSRGNSEHNASQDEDEDGDGGDDRRRSNKKPKGDACTPNGSNLLFACPYFKHDPGRFSSQNIVEKHYRGCDGHFLTDVSRLKQHLKRVHWEPESYCPRCYKEFDSSATLSEHAGSAVACPVKKCPFPERMNKTKQGEIHIKRPRIPAETVWYDIFKVLFPGSPLPDSPYVQKEEKLVTPTSAAPLPALNDQATQQLHTLFQNRLDQYQELQDNPLRPLIQQALTDSFIELLNTFSLSSAASPSAAPSIVVSPISRSSSGNTRASENSVCHHEQEFASNGKLSPAVVNIASQPKTVPLLQQPRPPKLHGKAALQVPPDYHCSSANHTVETPDASGSSVEHTFNVNIPIHVQEDQGYDDECHSFEHGDDQQAMAFFGETTVPPWRNKSVMSIDSGYGSGRLQQHPHLDITKSMVVETGSVHNDHEQGTCYQHFTHRPHEQPSVHTPNFGDMSVSGFTNHAVPDQSVEGFHSYSNYLDPSSQYMLDDPNYPFIEANNPWRYA